MGFSNTFYLSIRNKITLSSVIKGKVQLTRQGNEFIGLCPFHKEKTPSFSVNDVKRFYYCFGCKATGDVIKFVSEDTGLSYYDAAIKLAKDYGIPIEKSNTQDQQDDFIAQLHSVLEISNLFFQSQLNKSEEIKKYLNERNISNEHIKNFEIGFIGSNNALLRHLSEKKIPLMLSIEAGVIAKKSDDNVYDVFRNRIIFPIRNVYNNIVGFGGRIFERGHPKYLNSRETVLFKKQEVFYGENTAFKVASKKNRVILVEGYTDVIAMHRHGFTEAVASLGTAINKNHLLKLWQITDEIILCLDGDLAGLKAYERILQQSLELATPNKQVSFVIFPNDLDPDEFLEKYQANAMENIIQNRLTLSEMIWLNITNSYKIITPESKAQIKQKTIEYLGLIDDKILREFYSNFFKQKIYQLKNKGRTNRYFPRPVNLISKNLIDPVVNIEYKLLSIIVYTKLIEDNQVKNDFELINFQDERLQIIKNSIMKLIAEQNFSISNIDKVTYDLKLNKIFKTLFKFYDFLSKQSVNFENLWHILLKQHNLNCMLKEYTTLVSIDPDNKNIFTLKKKLLNLQQEIKKL